MAAQEDETGESGTAGGETAGEGSGEYETGREGSGWDDFSYCRVPVNLLDFYLAGLSKAEMLVIFYIIRRTFGFGKRRDAISYNQFLNGICTGDGRRLDYGTGLSRKSLVSALDSLVKKGVISREARQAPGSGRMASVYELNLDYFHSRQPSPPAAGNAEPPEAAPALADSSGPLSRPVCPLDKEVKAAASPGASEIYPAPGVKSFPAPGVKSSPIPGVKITPPPGVKSSPTPGVKSRPTIESINQNKVNQNIDSDKSGFDVMPLELIKAGIWPHQAERLAAKARARGRDCAYLQGWTGWLKGRENVRNPAAFLAKMVEANADPPAARPGNSPPSDPTRRYREESPAEAERRYRDEHRRRTGRLLESARKYGLAP